MPFGVEHTSPKIMRNLCVDGNIGNLKLLVMPVVSDIA